MAKAAMRDLHRFDSYVVIGRSQATGFAVLAFVCVYGVGSTRAAPQNCAALRLPGCHGCFVLVSKPSDRYAYILTYLYACGIPTCMQSGIQYNQSC